MKFSEIYSAAGMMELIQEIGFLPLLDSGINGFSAEAVVTEDCGYVTFPDFSSTGKSSGWGWSLLNTPEELYGKEACTCDRTPEESFQRIYDHLRTILPEATDKQILKLIG